MVSTSRFTYSEHDSRGADNRVRAQNKGRIEQSQVQRYSAEEGGRDGWGHEGSGSRQAATRTSAHILSQAARTVTVAPSDSQATSHPSKRGHTRGRPRHSRHESKGDMRIRTAG